MNSAPTRGTPQRAAAESGDSTGPAAGSGTGLIDPLGTPRAAAATPGRWTPSGPGPSASANPAAATTAAPPSELPAQAVTTAREDDLRPVTSAREAATVAVVSAAAQAAPGQASAAAVAQAPVAVAQAPTAAVAPANPLAAIDTAVQKWFASTATLLGGLPNGVGSFLQGALLLVHRGLFNPKPTAQPSQIARVLTGDVVGDINGASATDTELTYSVATAPQYGTVTVDASGLYTYTPGENFTGTDTFAVAVANKEGINLLDLAGGPTVAPVTVQTTLGVKFNPESLPPLTSSRGFDIYNLTSRPLLYVGDSQCATLQRNCGGFEGSGPETNQLVMPGDHKHFEVTYNFTSNTYAYPQFETITGEGTDPANLGPATFRVQLNVGTVGGSYIGTTKVTGKGEIVDDDTNLVYLQDPVGTVARVPATNVFEQGELLNNLCLSGSSAGTCSWGPPEEGRYKFDSKDFNLNDWSPLRSLPSVPDFTNDTPNPVKVSIKYTTEVTEGSSLEISAEASAGFGSIVSASVSTTVNFNSEVTTGFEQSYEFEYPAYQTTTVGVQDPVKTVNGTMTAQMGNTTFILSGMSYSVLDTGRKARFRLTSTAV